MVVGFSAVTGATPKIDASGTPIWVGYLMLCGGFLLMLAFFVDRILLPERRDDKKASQNTLKERIRKAEQGGNS